MTPIGGILGGVFGDGDLKNLGLAMAGERPVGLAEALERIAQLADQCWDGRSFHGAMFAAGIRALAEDVKSGVPREDKVKP